MMGPLNDTAMEQQSPDLLETPATPSRWRRGMLIAAEVMLVLVILALLVANWVPILIGARAQRPG